MIEQYSQYSKERGLSLSLFLPWIVCVCSSLFFFYEFIQGNMFASIADNIMQDFHIQADKMTYLSSAYYLANVFFLFVAGFILDRYSTKKTLLIAMTSCVLSTFLMAYAHSFYLAFFCRFIMGIGAAFCFLGPVRLASRWFPARRMAMVTGIIVTIAMLGGMMAQYPMAVLVNQVGWRQAMIVIGWLGVGILVLMVVGIIDKDLKSSSEPVIKKTIRAIASQAYLNPQTLRAALYASLMNMVIAVFGAMMGSLYLMQRLGITKEDAAFVNSFLFLGVMFGGPVLGYISDKLGLRVLPMKWSVLIALTIILLILYLPVSLLAMKYLFFLLGFFTSAQVISYALVAESNQPSMTATAVSVVSLLVQGGYIVYQNLFSTLLIHHGGMRIVGGVPVYSLGDYGYATIILPLGLLLAFLILFGLKETFARPVKELG